VCIVLADNQAAIGRGLHDQRVAINVGRSEHLTVDDIAGVVNELLGDAQKRLAMSAAGRSLIDGKGADRVAEACWRLQ
jgi:spore coat polysaccharide biosynthesis predicted glycosyltransferase SpsG